MSRQRVDRLTASFLLWERERAMLKNLAADSGGGEALPSLPLEDGSGGEAAAGPRPPERLSMLGEELSVLELWPDGGKRRRGGEEETIMSDRSSRPSHDGNTRCSSTAGFIGWV